MLHLGFSKTHNSRLPRRVAALATAFLVLSGLAAGCTDDPKETASKQTGPFYLSIGDSYAAGFRPPVDGRDAENSTDGFAWKVASQTGLTLVNYACSGITAVDFMNGTPCVATARPIGGPEPTEGSEGSAVLDWLEEHGDEVELVTVVLGGNDVQGCIDAEDWRSCSRSEMERVEVSLSGLLAGVRSKIPASTPVIGLSYPNVLLANPVLSPVPDSDAADSIEFFDKIVNPSLKSVYRENGAKFANVTKAFGSDLPETDTVDTKEFGVIAKRAEQICVLTYYCELRDLHPTNAGHRKIAELVLKTSKK